MKKIFLTIAMTIMLSLSMLASEESTTKMEAYNMSVNTERLAESLGASADQAEAICDVMTLFNQQMANMSVEESDSVRQKMLDNTIKMNTSYMKHILDKDQYKKYLMLLNTTLVNRGIVD
jgi:hypothetical protein